jgi:hypothetical protein
MDLTANLSMMAWVWTDVVGDGILRLVLSANNTDAYAIHYSLENIDAGENDLRYEIANSGTAHDFALANITTNSWFHAGFTYDNAANAVEGYQNGVKGTSRTDTGTPTTVTSLAIAGVISPTTTRWDGFITDIRLYNRTLSAAEMATIYACKGHDGINQGLVGRWHCSDREPGFVFATNTMRDLSVSAQNGTGTGGIMYAGDLIGKRRRVL